MLNPTMEVGGGCVIVPKNRISKCKNRVVKVDCGNLWPSKCCSEYLSYNSGVGFADLCW